MEQDQPMEQDEPVEQVEPLVPQRKKRGPNKMKTKPVEPFDVVFNIHGEAINDHQCWFANHIGNITRLRISIVHETWRHVPKEQKEALWLNVKDFFDLKDNDARKTTIKQCNLAWKRFKTRLKSDFMDEELYPPDYGYSMINMTIWEAFCKQEDTPEKKEMRVIGRLFANLQKNHPHLGRLGYRGRKKVNWDKIEMNEALKNEIQNMEDLRTKEWIMARLSKPDS